MHAAPRPSFRPTSCSAVAASRVAALTERCTRLLPQRRPKLNPLPGNWPLSGRSTKRPRTVSPNTRAAGSSAHDVPATDTSVGNSLCATGQSAYSQPCTTLRSATARTTRSMQPGWPRSKDCWPTLAGVEGSECRLSQATARSMAQLARGRPRNCAEHWLWTGVSEPRDREPPVVEHAGDHPEGGGPPSRLSFWPSLADFFCCFRRRFIVPDRSTAKSRSSRWR